MEGKIYIFSDRCVYVYRLPPSAAGTCIRVYVHTYIHLSTVCSVRICGSTYIYRASLVARSVKNLPAMQETWVRLLGWEDLLEKEKATPSSTLACRIPWTEEPGGLQSLGSQRVGHNLAAKLPLGTYLEVHINI